MYTSGVWHGEEWRLVTWPANVNEHLIIMKQMHIDGSSVCSEKIYKCGLYFCKRKYCEKKSILIVSRQRHSSWNRLRTAALKALDVLLLQLWLRTASDDSVCVAGNWTNHSNWFTNRFTGLTTGLTKPLNRIDSENSRRRVWNKLKHF